MKALAALVWVFSIVSILSAAEAAPSRKTSESCHQFVQAFYDWYLPNALNDKLKKPSFEMAIEKKGEVFEDTLLKSLRDDAEAQRKSKDGIVGLDFDPFLSSQDPAHHYDIGPGDVQGDICTVIVQANDPTFAKESKPDVLAQAEYKSGWKFKNFVYPNLKSDLISTLKVLKKDREKSK